MNDPREQGLDELGQRLQALGGPAGEPRPMAPRESYAPGAQSRPYPEGSFSSAPQAGNIYQNAAYPEAPYPDGGHREATFRGAPLPIGPATGGRTPEPGVTPERPERLERPSAVREAAADMPGTPLYEAHGPAARQSQAHAAGPTQTPASNQASAQAPTQAQLPASTGEDTPKSGFHRLAQVVRTALPYVQKLLPLLDGNLVTTVSALLAPQGTHPQPAPQVTVNLEPVERQMAELRTGQQYLSTSQQELRAQVAEQGATLKGVEDQLERVREATDRNTLEQQELVEDLRSVGSRISKLAVVGLVLLGLSVGFNLYLLILLQHLLR